jgi:uncharacterized protein (TIRG00374 family)
VAAGVAAIAYLCYEIGPRAVWDSFRTLGWRLVLVVWFPFILAVLLDTWGWGALLRDRRVPFAVLLRARLAGEAVNMVTPTASVGGEPLKAYMIRPHVPLPEGLGSVVADKTTVVAGQILLLPVGLYLATAFIPLRHPLMLAMTVLLTVQVLAVGGFVVAQTLGVFGGSGRVLGRLGRGPAAHRQRDLNQVDQWLRRLYRERRGALAASTLLHTAAWATGALEIYLVVHFLGADVSLVLSLILETFGGAVRFASFMIPASLGALEGGYVAIFKGLGLSGALGLSYMLVRRIRELVWAGLGLLWLAASRGRPTLDDEEESAPSAAPTR